MDIFEKLSVKIHKKRILIIRALKDHIEEEKLILRKFIFPIYLLPVKFFTYGTYYIVKFIFTLLWKILRFLIRVMIYPFKKFSNLLRSIALLSAIAYFLLLNATILLVITEYSGNISKFFCLSKYVEEKVVRIVGGYSQGSGFFIEPNKVVTNFHVIDGEPSPKIITARGNIIRVNNIVGDPEGDLAILTTDTEHSDLVLTLNTEGLYSNEQIISIGYPLGTDIIGPPTKMKGLFESYRYVSGYPVSFIQSNLTIVSGMSGGPLVDRCGEVIGVNVMGVAGLSMFIDINSLNQRIGLMSSEKVEKLELHPEKSPQDAVIAFYKYISMRNMEEGYKLLSKKYLEKTNFDEWSRRFENILNVEIVLSETESENDNTVRVKFLTDTWDGYNIIKLYYEGTWETVLEEGVYKMNKSNIKEVNEPSYEWYFNLDEEVNRQNIF